VTTMFDHTSFAPAAASPNGTDHPGDPDGLTLRAFAPGGLRAGCPATTSTGDDVVVLSYDADDTQRVDVYTRDGTRSLPVDTPPP
jgi:hypothetical protein